MSNSDFSRNNTGTLTTQNSFVVGFFDCLSYKTPDGISLCFPFFCPMAICGTCCILGRIHTLLTNEPIDTCEMGTNGKTLCCLSCIINSLGPFGGFCWFGLNSIRLRQTTMKKYGIQDNTVICGLTNPILLEGNETVQLALFN
jgi:hypothetical protein